MARGDSFFEGGDGDRKRKRGTGNKQQQQQQRESSRGGRGGRGRGRGRGGGATTSNGKGKGRQIEGSEEDEEEGEGDEEPGQRRRRGGDAASSDSDDALLDGGNANDDDDGFDSLEEEEARETPAQKRLRLAKQYLDTLKASQEASAGDIDAAELERDIIAERLQKDVLEHSGKLHLRIADRLAHASSSSPSSCSTHTTDTKVHRQSVTCAVASEDCRFLFTSSKDGSIARWDLSALLASLSSSTSPATPAAALPSPSTSSSASSVRRLILKTDFQPKRPAPRRSSNARNANAGGAHAKAHPLSESRHFVPGKGKAPIARNQVSGDAETRGHTDAVYSLSLSGNGRRLCSGGADRRIGVWDVSPSPASAPASASTFSSKAGAASKKEKATEKSYRSEGGALRWLGGLRGHKDAIMSLSFRLGTSTLYSSSLDRTVKVHDVPALAYVETLFGHQDRITAISTLKGEVAVTAGARDKTLRYWKIRDESQLVFRAGGMSRIRRVLEGGIDEEDLEGDDNDEARKRRKQEQDGRAGKDTRFVEGSVDATAMIDDQHFLSGGDSGTISLWSTTKKKPIFSHPLAHGVDVSHSEIEGTLQAPRWITSLAALPYADLFASGSWDGQIRLWRIAEDLRSFAPVALPGQHPHPRSPLPALNGQPPANGHDEKAGTGRAEDGIPARGFINSIQLLPLPHATFASASAATTANGTGKVSKRASASSGPPGVMLVAALGQESKFGRWKVIKEARNCAVVVVLQSQDAP